MTNRGLAVSALAAAGLFACASAPPPMPGHAQRQAIALNQSAQAAFERGDLARARALYEQALAADTSVENAEGIAINALSLARIHQLLGEPAAAQRYLDRLLEDGAPAIPRGRKAEAAARKAQLELAASSAAAAERWADIGLTYCARGCAAEAALLNLRARAALTRADAPAALQWATQALSAAPEDRGRAERANALRVIGEAHLVLREQRTALQALEQALALDQALGLPPRVRSDLMLLGRAHATLGERAAALGYFRRALAVANAAGDSEGAREAQSALDRN